MQNPQRFSGRELGPLLAQVRDALGEDATILEANRLRDGGIGGFFAKERFEVLAAPSDGDPTDDGEPNTAPLAGDALAEPAGADRADRAAVTGTGGGDHLDHLLQRAERVNVDEQWASQPALARSAAVNATDPGGQVDADQFVAVLQAALSQPEPASGPIEPSTNGHHPAAVNATTEQSPPTPSPAVTAPPRPPAPNPPGTAPPMPTPTPQPPEPALPVPPAPVTGSAATPEEAHWAGVPGGAFWAALARFEGRIDEAPLVADITCIVGPLDDAVGVARSLAGLVGVDQGDLVVFTDSRRVEGVPPWQLVDRRDELADRIQYWRDNGRRALVVVELEPGERALERAGRTVEVTRADLTRLVTPDLDQPAALAATLRGLGPVMAIDVSRPPRPEALVEAVARGVRIGTVCGRPLTAMMLAGLTATIGVGRG